MYDDDDDDDFDSMSVILTIVSVVTVGFCVCVIFLRRTVQNLKDREKQRPPSDNSSGQMLMGIHSLEEPLVDGQEEDFAGPGMTWRIPFKNIGFDKLVGKGSDAQVAAIWPC
jgi:hypothetical protein